MLEHAVCPSRRLSSRIETPPGIWVYWLCDGRADLSPVQNVSLGGVFLNTPKASPIDSRAEIHFCVQEGQIRTEGIVRHVAPGRGLGLRFTAIKETDRSASQSVSRGCVPIRAISNPVCQVCVVLEFDNDAPPTIALLRSGTQCKDAVEK